MNTRKALGTCVLTGAVALSPACSLEKAYPAKNTFVVHAGEAHAAGAPRPETVRVEGVRIAPPFDGRNLVYRDGDVAYREDYYNVFIADPDDLATGELVRMLSQSRAFSDVLGASSMASAGLNLECTVTELYADERDPRKATATCTARYRLLRELPGETTVVGDWTFEQAAPVGADSGAAAAAAMGKAFGGTVNRFIDAATMPGAAAPAK
jgi:uncharacterized lipoprotein YmbA